MSLVNLSRGDLFPWAALRDAPGAPFGYQTVAGCYLVFPFDASAVDPAVEAALATVRRNCDPFNDERARFFGVGRDPRRQDGRARRRRAAGPALHER